MRRAPAAIIGRRWAAGSSRATSTSCGWRSARPSAPPSTRTSRSGPSSCATARSSAAGHNERELRQDPTAHAEVLALREAARAAGVWRVLDSVLYVTLEPCAMCAGAIVLARVPRVVFGCPDPKAGAAGSVLDVLAEPRLNHRPDVAGGPAGGRVRGAADRLLRRAGAEDHSIRGILTAMSATEETTAQAEAKAPSFELTQDQKDIRDWVHGFAADVVRPAAHEWDEREETPWPVIQEAAKIGLYGFEGLAQFFGDPSGLSLPIVNEELFWGDAGHRHGDHGHVAGRGRHLRPGDGRADRRVDPALLRHGGRPEGRGVLLVGAERRLGRLRHPHDAPSSTRRPASGSSTARRRGRRTAASPTSTSSSPASTGELRLARARGVRRAR